MHIKKRRTFVRSSRLTTCETSIQHDLHTNLLIIHSLTTHVTAALAINRHKHDKLSTIRDIYTHIPMKTFLLFIATALTEIIGCYLPYLWLRENCSIWLLLPAALSLIAFVWLLTLHPAASGRVYAAYGGVYVSVAILWLWAVDKITPSITDIAGVALCLAGMAIIMFGARSA